MRHGGTFAAVAAASLALCASAYGAKGDYAGQAFNVLPPGQAGTISPTTNSLDQLRLYDGLTPLQGNVSAADVRRYFKDAHFGARGKTKTDRVPMRGVKVVRDKYGVPHITGKTRAATLFAAGWVTAQDRSILLETIRGPGRVAAIDAPALDPFGLATSVRSFTPSAQTEKFLSGQVKLLRRAGKPGRQAISDVDAYVAGINAEYRKTKSPAKPWTRNDAIAVGALIGAKFGKDGGDEARRAEFLSQLEAKLGAGPGTGVFNDLANADDPETPVSLPGRFPYALTPSGATPGSPPVDAGSLDAAAEANGAEVAGTQPQTSNALLVGAKRSKSGHPLAVMGPQTGFTYPNIFLEVDMHGGGLDVRGAMLPGLPYPVIGRGADFAWSITSEDADNTDQFLEELCNPDGSAPTRDSTSYVYKGKCTPMANFDGGKLGASGSDPEREVTFKTTVHGPVAGTATVGGKPYAISTQRSTYGRDLMSVLGLQQLDTGVVHSPQTFIKATSKIDFVFNWFYADNKHIAMFSSGRLPKRAPGVNPRLATLGTGQFDWRGFLTPKQHPQAIDPKDGIIVNWNNKPARGFTSADNEWGTWGSAERAELFTGFKRSNRLEDVVGVMNKAATQDARAVLVWPTIAKVLATGPAPDARSQQAADLVTAWANAGGSRLDKDGDGKIDAPGAAVLDAAWPRLAKAVVSPVLGDALTTRLPSLARIDRNAPDINHGATSNYGRGWYTYVEKDLRTLVGEPVQGKFSAHYCGNGDLASCRASLWQAVKDSADEIASAQGPDPSAWRQDARPERIIFQPGLLGPSNTIRWTNRPTSFQQVMEFSGHR